LITIEKVRQRAEADARTYGYFLHPDPQFLQYLLEGLKQNEERYGYPSCPCRTASGVFEYDRDIFCPCDYRDPDVAEFGCCYCALYVRKDLYEGKTPILPIPERRPKWKQERAYSATPAASTPSPAQVAVTKEAVSPAVKKPLVGKKLWYCRQCGYVVFREDPPYVCPICKARREMFREIDIQTSVRNKEN
jgi:ferredoxin-thioredoxin reductase catalytic subunit